MFTTYYYLLVLGDHATDTHIMEDKPANKLSLLGSVSLGTGVMIGAGIFALMGQVAALAGNLFPLAFLVAAVVVGLSSYSYIRLSNAYPSSGGVASYLRRAYGPGTLAGSLSLLMYVSMVIAESLVARTFGAYTLRLFTAENLSVLVPALGVGLLAFAYVINIAGNKIIGSTATAMAIIKILGIALFAIAGIAVANFASLDNWGYVAGSSESASVTYSFVAALALSILAYKGFTTIANQGGDIVNPHRNVGRAIIISIAICTVIYVALALAVSGNLSVQEIVVAQNYALAEAAKPVFGDFGLWFTVLLAIVATVSGIIASVFSASRLLAMLSRMKQLPDFSGHFKSPALIYTILLAMTLTILFDLSRIAAIGAIYYLIMDMSVHWGVFRRLRQEIGANPIIPLVAILFDIVILAAFLSQKFQDDRLVLIVSLVGLILIVVTQRLFMLTHTDRDGTMHMEMEMDEGESEGNK